MLVTSLSRSYSKLERKCFDPQWLRPVIDDVPDGFLLESKERVSYVNRAYASYLHYRPHELIDQDVSFLVSGDDAPRLLQYSRRRVNLEPAPTAYDFLARRKDGSSVRLDASVSASRVNSTILIAAIARPFYDDPLVASDPSLSARNRLHEVLSPRELLVMEMILEGKRVKEIANQLAIDAKTVATHRFRMMKKLHLSDNRSLFLYAVRHGLIDWS